VSGRRQHVFESQLGGHLEVICSSAVSGASSPSMSGYHDWHTEPKARLRVFTRRCSSRCTPRVDHWLGKGRAQRKCLFLHPPVENHTDDWSPCMAQHLPIRRLVKSCSMLQKSEKGNVTVAARWATADRLSPPAACASGPDQISCGWPYKSAYTVSLGLIPRLTPVKELELGQVSDLRLG
jgi:hypothetical protein